MIVSINNLFYPYNLPSLPYNFCRLSTGGEVLQDKPEKTTLQKGLLLEFKKDSERVLLAVAQKPDGKKNWMVFDQVC